MRAGVFVGVVGVAAGICGAAPIIINESAVGGGSFVLNPGTLSPTVFGAPPPTFGNNALAFIHNQLMGDGVNTDNIITVIAADTDHGLALFALLDQQSGPFTSFNARLDVSAVAHDASANGINGWVNDDGGELIQIANANPIANTYTFNTTFQWDSNGTGDSFANSNLDVGDSGSLVFNMLPGFGATGVSRGFQYVSYDNGAWGVVGTGGFNGTPGNPTSTSFDWRVVPVPGSAALGAVGLGVLGLRRRRAR
ncbi:MAG: hypothetical protein R3B68_05510 [Phycisphaerales bacterium]